MTLKVIFLCFINKFLSLHFILLSKNKHYKFCK